MSNRDQIIGGKTMKYVYTTSKNNKLIDEHRELFKCVCINDYILENEFHFNEKSTYEFVIYERNNYRVYYDNILEFQDGLVGFGHNMSKEKFDSHFTEISKYRDQRLFTLLDKQ